LRQSGFLFISVSILNALITTVIWFQIHSINISGTIQQSLWVMLWG